MTFRERLKHWWNRMRRRAHETRQESSKQDLREFVYLDEVSLRSLLSSVTGEITESRSEQLSDEFQSELAGTVGANNPLVGKAEVASRFQTSNSSTIQTSKKATVQSWFRDFHAIAKLRLVDPDRSKCPACDKTSLLANENESHVARSDDLHRGELVEFKVKLAADPVYHLSTIVSEFTGMVADHPDMFATGNTIASLREVQPINKILERLLVGLIPIRAVAVDYSVVTIGEIQYVVHNRLLQRLQLKRESLQVVGVTEHLAYWKDLRRVLFSDAEFTVLGRVARSGLQSSWTPVKLADLFQFFVPDLAEQISAAGRNLFTRRQSTTRENDNDAKLVYALGTYAFAALANENKTLNEDQQATLAAQIVELRKHSSTASDQKSAFARVHDLLNEFTGIEIEPSRDMELREHARTSSGLSLFPALTSSARRQSQGDTQAPSMQDREHLLDIEVIAIYW